MTMAQSFKTELSNGLLNYPINEMDDAYFEEHGKPPSGKYAKMLRRATPIANEVWLQSLAVKTTLHDIKHLNDFVFTNRGMESLVEMYAALNVELQDLNKLIKKTKQEQPLQEYYEQYSELYSVNVFDMMVTDLETLMPYVVERNDVYNASFPESNSVLTHTTDDMKAYFKEACKDYKEKKSKIPETA